MTPKLENAESETLRRARRTFVHAAEHPLDAAFSAARGVLHILRFLPRRSERLPG